jgi:hypothetical protein
MFGVDAAQPLGLNSDDAKTLAAILEQRSETMLAGQIRDGLQGTTLVEFADEDRQPFVDALNVLFPNAKQPEQVEALVKNLRARIDADVDTPTPPVEQ